MADQATIPESGQNAIPHISLERLGWMRCRWSWFHFCMDPKMDDCGPGAWYASGFVVLGFWVYQFRIWTIEKAVR